jgi:transposase
MLNKKNGLSRYRIGKLMRCFCADLTASQAALLLGLNRKTVNRYFGRFRTAIAAAQERDKAAFSGIVEVDESFFGAERIRGHPGPRKRGRGTLKQPVFGIFERGGRVYTEVIPDAKAPALRAVVRGHIALDAVLVTDGWPGYNGLVDVGYDRHLRINKSKHFAKNGVHVNGIESFWSFTKRRLAKFNGAKPNFPLHLKECEWRWGKDFDTLVQELNRLMV